MHPMSVPEPVARRSAQDGSWRWAAADPGCAHWRLPPAAAPTNPRAWAVARPAHAGCARGLGPGTARHCAAPRPRIGLVLSGGGARGAAHIGVLKVLEELRVPIDVIAGTSMGSIVGGSYASGQTVSNMERDVANIKTEMLARDQPPRAEISIHLKQEDWLDFIGPQFGFRDGSLLLPKGAITGVALEAVLRELALAKGDWNFDKLPIPFRAIATDVVSGQMTVLTVGRPGHRHARQHVGAGRDRAGADRRQDAGRRRPDAQPAGGRGARHGCRRHHRREPGHAAAASATRSPRPSAWRCRC